MSARSYKDSFGRKIEEGDLLYTASSQGGQAKIGTAYFAPNSLMLEDVIHGAGYRYSNAKRQPVGSHILLLMRAEETHPDTLMALISGTS